MSHLHPFATTLLPFLEKYPSQAPAIFQAYQDLYLAQSWKELEIIDLISCKCVILRGIPKQKSSIAYALPMALGTPTSIRTFVNVFRALESIPSPTSKQSSKIDESPTIYLAIAEKDSSIVYYVLKNGIVSPKEVPE